MNNRLVEKIVVWALLLIIGVLAVASFMVFKDYIDNSKIYDVKLCNEHQNAQACIMYCTNNPNEKGCEWYQN